MYQGMQDYDKKAARRLVKALLKRNCSVSVFDGEEWAVFQSNAEKEIIDAMLNTDMDTVKIHDEKGNFLGSFFLVYGEGEGDTIADHSDNTFCQQIYEEVTR